MSERIEIEGIETVLRPEGGTPKRLPLRRFLELIRTRLVSGRRPEASFDGVRFRIDAGEVTVLIIELPPSLRSLLWATDDSPESLFDPKKYRMRALATPYIVLKVTFVRGGLHHNCELFFRPKPLERATDPLFWSNLRNVTPDAYGCLAWLCTAGLRPAIDHAVEGRPDGPLSMRWQVELLVDHLWGGGFNASSDLHEGRSCFSRAVEKKIDPRICDVDTWERASREDYRFALDVHWEPTGETIDSVLDRELARWKVPPAIEDTAALIGELIACPRGARKRRTA